MYKTLGVWWLADQDVFTFKETAPENSMSYTKRNFLKKIATLFDPIGFLVPFTIRAKMLLQDMWTAGMDWDDELTEPLISSSRAWFGELGELKDIQVPRRLWNEGMIAETMSLHTCIEASEKAYGAVVYARCQYQDGSVSTNIVAAKTRVIPNMHSKTWTDGCDCWRSTYHENIGGSRGENDQINNLVRQRQRAMVGSRSKP